ncbi:DeoR/GlpR family DNA-binding transcription regulator [Streptantibioticus ferralitis]|uniref:DeoR/GlpR family DNA-binding transcription regulator n=1 Tax=Streptantibioticus ferralitis TaxID=236510 RepID=A0ABT5YWH7_9ACTN|nr:DeoR/GlpR family DNA-binding transcription regulator [Streptantibioticus ferralitis]MDF2255706.1 DeoR/GlpR family DNA-binding transcription regulator [Streptantibioticus ferralitis]
MRHERLTALLELLGERGQMGVEEAAGELGVSAATVRRDMDTLAEQQLLTRTRGGAVLSSVAYDLPIRYKGSQRAPEKRQIAQAASALVPRGSVVGLSGGTTTTEIARTLASRPDLAEPGPNPHLTVVTNALNIANELAVRPQIKIVLTGGVAQPRSFELVGPYSDLVLREVTMDIAFIGVNGLDPKVGATVHDEREARVNRLMAERATRPVVVSDSSKLGLRAFAAIGTCDLFDTLITDEGADEEIRREFAERGLRIITAPVPD